MDACEGRESNIGHEEEALVWTHEKDGRATYVTRRRPWYGRMRRTGEQHPSQLVCNKTVGGDRA